MNQGSLRTCVHISKTLKNDKMRVSSLAFNLKTMQLAYSALKILIIP